MIDCNAYLSHWPFRRVPLDEPASLLRRMDVLSIEKACVGSFDALLHRDVEAVNARLARTIAENDPERFHGFGCVNPALPDWQEDLRRCVEQHGMVGIRLHPAYHGYLLDDPRMAQLLRMSSERNIPVQIVLKMEDERTQHPLLRVPYTPPRPLISVLQQISGCRIMLLNALRDLRGGDLEQIVNETPVLLDIAMLEGIGGIENLIRKVPPQRIVWGTFAPLFAPESAVGKLRESSLGQRLTRQITIENCRKFLEPLP